MTRRTLGRLAGFFIVSLMVAVGASIGVQALDTQIVSSSYGPTGYRGVVSANFNASDAREEIVGDFGSIGVWVFHTGSWSQITTSNPEWIFAVKWGDVSDYELIADFGSIGLWQWNYSGYPGVWTQLTASNPDGGIAVDDDGDGKDELQIDFGTLGLWRYELDNTTWTRLTTLNPAQGLRTMLASNTGWEEGSWDFDATGLWYVYFNNTTGNFSWHQITASNPGGDWAAANFTDASGTDERDEFVVEFSDGVWFYDSGTWSRVSSNTVDAMVPAKFSDNFDTELVVSDPGDYPWIWYGVGSAWERPTWTLFDDGFVVPFDADGLTEAFPEDEFGADFGTAGLWKWNYTAYPGTWTRLTASDPVWMVSSDYYGDGVRTALICNFGPGMGVWIYDSGGGLYPAEWNQITFSVPNGTPGW